jgi:type III secretion system YscI/HrpB-like protein
MELSSIGVAASTLAKTAAPAGASSAAPDTGAADRFRSLMAPDTTTTDTTSLHLPAVAPTDAAAPANLGDAILQKLHAMSGEMDAGWQTLTSVGGAADAAVTVPQMMKFQAAAMQTSFQFELVGKVVSKSESDIEALVKMQ